jgi:hypothetical protein
VIVSNRHFELDMARSAECNQVAENVRLVLVVVVPARVDMVNVKSAPAGAVRRAAILTHLVTAKDEATNIGPIAPVTLALPAAPMGAVLSGHVGNGAFAGTEAPPLDDCRGERGEQSTALIASHNRAFTGGNVLTSGTAIGVVRVLEGNAADGAISSTGGLSAIVGMAITRAKDSLRALAVGLSLERLSAIGALTAFGFADRVNRALPRTVVHGSLIGFELCPALEARLEHY